MLSDFVCMDNLNFELPVMFASLRSNAILVFVQRTFDWGGEMVLAGEEAVGTWRQLFPNVSILKKP